MDKSRRNGRGLSPARFVPGDFLKSVEIVGALPVLLASLRLHDKFNDKSDPGEKDSFPAEGHSPTGQGSQSSRSLKLLGHVTSLSRSKGQECLSAAQFLPLFAVPGPSQGMVLPPSESFYFSSNNQDNNSP